MIITRTTHLEDILQATDAYKHELHGWYPDEWIKNPDNVALINENKDVSLFQQMLPGVMFGHYFYHSRGREALKTALAMRDEIFSGPYNVQVVQGLTPLQKLGARWLNRKLGFKSYGVIDTVAGPCEVVILTKEEWRQLNG